MHGRPHSDDVEHVGDHDFGPHVTQRVGPDVQLAHHGAYVMALFKQDRDGRVRGRADAAGGAGDEDGFLGHAAIGPCVRTEVHWTIVSIDTWMNRRCPRRVSVRRTIGGSSQMS